MQILIRKISSQDKTEIISMMREFYTSEAVFTNGSDEIFDTDFENCINNNPYLEGYVFVQIAKSSAMQCLLRVFQPNLANPVYGLKICI